MTRLLMEEYIITLCNVSTASDKRYGLKIVGKPCEGKPHARFDEGLLGRLWLHQQPTLQPLIKITMTMRPFVILQTLLDNINFDRKDNNG